MDLQNILTLARDNKHDAIRAAVSNGVSVNYCNPMGQTALHIAALWGNVESIRALLELGADVNVLNSRGTSPLHFAAAAKARSMEAVQALLSAGAQTNIVDFSGRVAFECADNDQVRRLLGGPDPRLFEYATAGKAAELQALLASEGAPSVRIVDSEGQTLLNLAVFSRSVETVKVLVAHDPLCLQMPDVTGNSALHAAVEAEDAAMVQYLLTLGLDLNEQNLNISEYAAGNWVVGGDEIMPSDKTGLHIAVEAGNVEITKMLLQAGANANIRDFDDRSALHLALEEGEEELVELLVQYGADTNQPNKDYHSPLHFATQSGSLKMVQLLLQSGADPCSANADGWTPLHLAARGKVDKAKALLNAGADPNAVNVQGNTPLHLAALSGNAELCRALIASGANRGVLNKEQKVPEDMTKDPDIKNIIGVL